MIKYLNFNFNRKKNEKTTEKNTLVVHFENTEVLPQLMWDYRNENLEDLVTNYRELNKIVEKNNRLIRKADPIFMIPTSTAGRAHFYAPVKRIGNRTFDTLWFNILAIWIYSLLLYLILYYDLVRKTVTFIENVRLRRSV